MSLEQNGFLTIEELKSKDQYPSEERFSKGPVAIIECTHEIPCNPCESSCKFGAISIGEDITKLPKLVEDKCIGCGVCVANCSGLAIFIVNKAFSESEGTVAFPFEYYPLPEQGQVVEAVNREGQVLCEGKVIKIQNPKSYDRTPVVTIAVPLDYVENIRGMKRI